MSLAAVEKERAAHAWESVQSVKSKGETTQKGYAALARGLGPDIILNGVGQTLAFLRSKGKHDPDNAYNLICGHLTDWVCRRPYLSGRLHSAESNQLNRLLTSILETFGAAELRFATREALTYALWLKRFATAELTQD